MQQQVNQILQEEPLVQLVQRDNFIGWVYAIDYDTANVMTNDAWKATANGVPHNCFLVAASFDPDHFAQATVIDREVILLRVTGSEKLPQENDLVRTKIDHFQRQLGAFENAGLRDYDDLTLNQLQFSGLACRVLGTFYIDGGALKLGSDLETFAAAARLRVYRPRGNALQAIVNYVDPQRQQAAAAEAAQLGVATLPQPFRIGTVRYTSTDRLHRGADEPSVPVHIQPSDFLARRTAVLGMTRTGKSNMVKQTVGVVKRVADQANIPIGQIIYDMNGEYANANQQDQGAIADVFPEQTVRYRMLQTAGFQDLRNNFYLQIEEGFALVRQILEETRPSGSTAGDVQTFLGSAFDQPDPQEVGEFRRWQVRTAAYQALLLRAGFTPPAGYTVRFEASQAVRNAVNGASVTGQAFPNPGTGLTLSQARDWFLSAREANRATPLTSTGGGGLWLEDATKAMLNMLANRSETNTFILGYRVLDGVRPYHSSQRQTDVVDEVREHLAQGRIVILDLSVGEATSRNRISRQIATGIFSSAMQTFVAGETPPNTVIYIEEAHNLIGKGAELTEIWPRIAKEGAKYRIALVYATQEVSSVHPNILSNTENWFISHLNNVNEIGQLARFYDFDDFSRSLLRAQDVGFARVKTLSSPFVIPVQIDRFDPAAADTVTASAGQ